MYWLLSVYDYGGDSFIDIPHIYNNSVYVRVCVTECDGSSVLALLGRCGDRSHQPAVVYEGEQTAL